MTETFDAACHCGTVQFSVTLQGGLGSARRCTCSYCTMRGAVAVSAALDGITFHAGADNLTLYQFGVNLACLRGISVWDLPEIPVNDGIHHPSDGAPPRIDGTLRYERTPI